MVSTHGDEKGTIIYLKRSSNLPVSGKGVSRLHWANISGPDLPIYIQAARFFFILKQTPRALVQL